MTGDPRTYRPGSARFDPPSPSAHSLMYVPASARRSSVNRPSEASTRRAASDPTRPHEVGPSVRDAGRRPLGDRSVVTTARASLIFATGTSARTPTR